MNGQIKSQRVVWWVLWASFQVGIVLMYFLLAKESARPSPQPESPLWMAAFAPPFVSMALRWLMIPRMGNSVRALPIFVLGLAFAELPTFLGIFIFPWKRQELFFVSVLTILQFIPVFVGRLIENDPPAGG